MTTVPPVGSTATATTTGTSGTSASNQPTPADPSLDYSAFLQLFLTQLKNQDPTQPMDPTAQLSQLATFSQVEQGLQTNQKLDQVLSLNALSMANGLIGHTATSGDGSVTGKILSIQSTDGGPLATLQDGSTLLMGNGVSVS